jgi:anti-sigma B factor antagonist
MGANQAYSPWSIKPMSTSRLLVEDYAGITLVTFTDSSILDNATIDQIGKDLYRLVDEEKKHNVIIDFSNVKFLSSHALGIILTLHKKAKGASGSLSLCGVRKELMKVFTLTDLDKIFKFYADDKTALAAHNVHL